MNFLDWFLEKTKIGAALEALQGWISGKMVYVLGIASATASGANILQNFSTGGIEYLKTIHDRPELAVFLAALAALGRKPSN